MSINPVVFSKETFESFTDFLISTLNIADEGLENQLKDLIAYDLLRGSRLVNGPYIYLNRPFVKGKSIKEFTEALNLDPVLNTVFTYENLHKHQEEAAESIVNKHHTIVSTGTGSGKTESFLLPIIDRAKKQQEKKLLALLIYPMNALVNDQLRRLRMMLAGTGVTFARYTGDTPETLPSNIRRPANMVRFTEEQLEEVIKGTLAPWEERLCREEIRENSPQIMLTNYSQLEHLLLRNKDLDIFRDSDLQFIVMDEVHSYVGELGSEVACLLRRLKLVVPHPENITFIGTSATVASRDEEPETVVKRFGSRLFGVEQDHIKLVTESYIELEREPDEYVPLFPRNPGEILKEMVYEVSQIPEDGEPGLEFYKLLTQLTYKTINKDNAYTILKKNVIISELQELFSKPALLEKAVERIRALSGRKDAGNDSLAAEIYSYLLAGLIVKEDNEPLLRPKIHFFVRGIQNLKVAFVDGQRQIILNDIDELQDHYYFSLYGCARCGQHYFVIPSASANQAEGVTFYTPVGMGDEPEESRMVLLTDVITGDEQAYLSQNVWVCEKCGTVHEAPVQKCMNTLCGSDKLIQMKKVPIAARLRCLSCGVSLGKDDEEDRSSNLMPSVSNEALDILILAQNMLNSVSKDAAKLLVFTDNRQEAAFQAAFINQRSKRFRLRDYLYAVLEEDRAYTSDELAGEIAERIREKGEYRDFEVENAMRPNYFKDSVEWFLLEDFFMPRYRRGSLENLGLVKLTYGNVVSSKEFVKHWAEEFGAPVEEILAIIENLLDHMRVNTGVSHKLLGITNRDPRVASGYINLSKWFGPEVYILNAPTYNSKSNLKWWISNSGTSYYQRFMKKAFPEKKDLADDFLRDLWRFLVDERVLVERENSHFAINSEAIYFTKAPKREDDDLPHLYECKKCGTRTFRKTPGLVCPRHNCDGQLTDVSVDTDDYNVKRHLSNREIRSLKAFEHSGQVRRPERERIEKEFKDENGTVNCIVATPTLELGVDIGKLDMVLLRNAPPTPANYDQRAGRAGRRHRIAVVTAYCGRSSHDLYFFSRPEEMITGKIKVPAFSMVNIPLIAKHCHSAITTKLHSVTNIEDKALMEAYLPNYINAFFNGIDLFADNAAETLKNLFGFSKPLEELINRHYELLREELERFFKYWPSEALKTLRESVEGELEDFLINGSPEQLDKIFIHIRDDLIFLINERAELFRRGSTSRELSSITKHLNAFMHPQGGENSVSDFYTISVLIKYGFFPGYSLAKGHVTARCLDNEGFVEIDRNYNIALREFAPLSRLYAVGKKYRPTRYNFYNADTKAGFRQRFIIVEDCIMPEKPDEPSFDNPAQLKLDSIHLTDPKLTLEGRPGDSENRRVIMGYDIRGIVKGNHLGGFTAKSDGMITSFRRKDVVVLINVGSKRDITNYGYGFYICPECGVIEENTPNGKDHFKRHLETVHNKHIQGERLNEYRRGIHAEFVSDVMVVGPFKSFEEAANYMEAMKVGASIDLDISTSEIDSFINGLEENYHVTFFETVPGGSGYIEVLFQYRESVMKTARTLLDSCDCKTACYRCLLSFWNQPYHSVLNRKKAIEVLDFIQTAGATTVVKIPGTRREKTSDGNLESPAEANFLNIVREFGLPDPHLQYQVTISNMTTIADFAYPDKKLLIYIDGYTYHKGKGQEKIDLDRRQELILKASGYEVIRIGAKDLDDDEMMELYLKSISKIFD